MRFGTAKMKHTRRAAPPLRETSGSNHFHLHSELLDSEAQFDNLPGSTKFKGNNFKDKFKQRVNKWPAKCAFMPNGSACKGTAVDGCHVFERGGSGEIFIVPGCRSCNSSA